MGLSKRTRFEVFKRDLFTCQYCGRRPPDVVLHCDHIVPKCKGGPDTMENLTTSCATCNAGKAGVGLGEVRPALDELDALAAIQEMAERRQSLERQISVAAAQRAVEDEAIETVRRRWIDIGGSDEAFQIPSIRKFLDRPHVRDMLEALDSVEIWWDRYRGKSQGYAWRYFCGVCWAKIREREPF